MTQSVPDPLEWLVRESLHLCAIREVEKLSAAIIDGLITLCQGERGYLFFCAAGPKALLPVASRGAGGLLVPSPDRRVWRIAERALAEPGRISIVKDERYGRSVVTVLMVDNEPQGILYVDGDLQDATTQARFIELYSQTAALALDNARFFERASNDLLTGLPNHSFFTEAVGRAIRESQDARKPHARGRGIVLLDLDQFRRVNHAAGAEVGDRALVDVAHTLRDSLCADGLVARWGADSFAILLAGDPRTPVRLRLHDVAERARAAVGAKIFAGVQLSACLGALPLPEKLAGNVADTLRTTLAACEALLQSAQKRGPGHIEVATADVPAKSS